MVLIMLEDGSKKYISQEIGEEYKEWRERDIIQIMAPTGTGKSTFIFYELLNRAIKEEKKILYLVNRKILKEQMEKELDRKVVRTLREEHGDIDIQKHIHINTYQHIEKTIKLNGVTTLMQKFSEYDFAVYDECHYFYTESNYNTNTQLSYEFLRNAFAKKIQIFMSATMDDIETEIEKWKPANIFPNEKRENYWAEVMNSVDAIYEKNKNKKYMIKKDYEYIKIQGFANVDELGALIHESKKKWLVFTDSKEKGISLKKQLIESKNIEQEGIVYIDADYENDEDAKNAVLEIKEKQKCSKKIIITTSVMDVGISFHDINLQNIVVLADTKDEFIQMLGRKRKDNQKVDVYICKRNLKHFTMRFQYVEKVLEFYDNFRDQFEAMYKRAYNDDVHVISGYMHLFYKENYCRLNNFSYSVILNRQQKIMEEIMNNSKMYENARKICYFIDGLITVNCFSVKRLRDLKDYYLDMIEKLEIDENAFFKQQLQWLGMDEERIENSMIGIKDSLSHNYKAELKENVDTILDKEMTKDDMISWKKNNSVRKYLEYFYKESDEYKQRGEKVPDNITKTDRPIQPKEFNICMKYAELPYIMKKESEKFIIKSRC